MELLRVLTLVYAGVLVGALAASLTAVWIYLRRISGALGHTYQALARVEERTRPLETYLEPLRSALFACDRDLRHAAAHFERADAALDSIVERSGAGVLGRSNAEPG